MKLELTFLKHIKALSVLIIIALVLAYLLSNIEYNMKIYIYIVAPIFIIIFLPTIYIHLNYYHVGKGLEYEMDEYGIKVIKNESQTVFFKNEIQVIELHMSGTKMAGLVIKSFPFEDYFYVKIIMKDDTKIVISCLFSSEINKIVESLYPDVPLIKIKDFYPTV